MTLLQRSMLSALLFTPLLACGESPAAQGCAVQSRATAPAPSQIRWPNEPTGMTTVSDVIGGDWSATGWRCEGNGMSVNPDPTTPFASPALVFTYQPGFPSGYAPGVAFLDLQTPTPETYFGLWWKPSNPWESHQSGVNKIALLFPATSGGGTIYIMMFYDGTRYTIQVETTFASDTRRLEPNLTATPVVLGKWHQVEWYVRYSSNPSSRDGVVRWWLDGVPQGAYNNLQMPPDPGFIEYTIRPVWGGGEGDKKRQMDSYSYGPAHISKR